jgi:hypothetical protein
MSGSAPSSAAERKVAAFAKTQDGTSEMAPSEAQALAAKLQPKVDELLSELSEGKIKRFQSLSGMFGISKLTPDSARKAAQEAGR